MTYAANFSMMYVQIYVKNIALPLLSFIVSMTTEICAYEIYRMFLYSKTVLTF